MSPLCLEKGQNFLGRSTSDASAHVRMGGLRRIAVRAARPEKGCYLNGEQKEGQKGTLASRRGGGTLHGTGTCTHWMVETGA